MKRYYVLQDGIIQASMTTEEMAVDYIRNLQKRQTHYILKANFSIIYGEEKIIPYMKEGD